MGLGRFSVCYEDTQVRLNLRRYSCIQVQHPELDKSCDIRLVNLKNEKDLALPKKREPGTVQQKRYVYIGAILAPSRAKN